MKNKPTPKNKTGKNNLPGYPHYTEAEDIYSTDKEETELDPENVSVKKTPNPKPDKPNNLSFEDDLTGEDIDVPGSELDDEQENVGSEDEENNYFSIGGDNHNDLDENTGKD